MKEDRDYYDMHFDPLFSKNFVEVKPKEFPYWRVYGFGMYKRNIVKEPISLGICLVKRYKVYWSKNK
jgi:hypothetical protein